MQLSTNSFIHVNIFAGNSPLVWDTSELCPGRHRLTILPEGCDEKGNSLTVDFTCDQDSADILCEQV